MKKILLFTSLAIVVALAGGGIFYFYNQKHDSYIVPIIKPIENQSISEQNLEVCAWAPWWDYEKSIDEVTNNPGVFDIVNPFFYSLNKSGKIEPQIENARKQVTKLEVNDNTKIIPTISNDFDAEVVSRIINSPSLMQMHIDDLVSLAVDNDYDGVEIDYELLYEEDKDAFSEFIKELASALHENDKLLSITLHPKLNNKGSWHANRAQDWGSLGEYADYIVIMAYDFHWVGSEAGPISPLHWVNDVLSYANKTLPNEKTYLGIGLYAYDWEEGKENAKEYTLKEALELAKVFNLDLEMDKNSQSPTFSYLQEGTVHEVWLEDSNSISQKIDAARENDLGGVCIWSLGGIPESYFDLLDI